MIENNDLLNEALLDLTIIIKKNVELVNENNILRKRMEEKEEIIRKLKNSKNN